MPLANKSVSPDTTNKFTSSLIARFDQSQSSHHNDNSRINSQHSTYDNNLNPSGSAAALLALSKSQKFINVQHIGVN